MLITGVLFKCPGKRVRMTPLLSQPSVALADKAANGLSDEEAKVPYNMEVAYIPYERGGSYPGIYLYTQVSLAVLLLQCPLLPSSKLLTMSAPQFNRPRG